MCICFLATQKTNRRTEELLGRKCILCERYEYVVLPRVVPGNTLDHSELSHIGDTLFLLQNTRYRKKAILEMNYCPACGKYLPDGGTVSEDRGGCPFCKDGKAIHNDEASSSLAMLLPINKHFSVFRFEHDNHLVDYKAELKYCPCCGRRMGGS